MKINKEELHRLYLNKVNEVAEECDWITSFSIEDVVRLISFVIEQNPHVVQIDINPHDGSTLDNFLLEEENKRLRKVISQIATNLGNGSVVSEEASIKFIEELPHEVKLVCDMLRKKNKFMKDLL